MTVRERTEILFRFEETKPVSEARYRGIGIWPLLRLRFLQALAREEEPRGEETVISESTETVEDTAQSSGREEHKRNRMERQVRKWIEVGSGVLNGGEVFYLIQSSKVVVDEKDQAFHRLFDSLIELTGTRPRSRFLYWNDSEAAIEPEKFKSPAIHFTPLFGKVRRMSRLSGREGADVSSRSALMALVDCWNGENPGAAVDADRLLQDCETLIGLVGVFQKLLEVRPRAVFLTCFYSLPAFALAHACRLLKIPCIEMQHGQQGDWHSMYTHRFEAGALAPDLLPSDFWAWGKNSQERMQKWWSPQVTAVHLGGNPWITYRADPRRQVTNEQKRDSDKKKVCLISMQSPAFDEFVVETIKRRSDIAWWIRLHPRNFRDRELLRARCKKDFGDDVAWELDRASSADLYDLFGEVDLHLTGWSTTAHEAIHFGVPTILIHPNGKSAMGEAIAAGVFGYAEDAVKLSQLIDAPPFRCDVEPLMRSDGEELRAVFDGLVKSSASVLSR